MTDKKSPENKLNLKKITNANVILDEASKRKLKARKAIQQLNQLKKEGANIIDQFNADNHADTVVQNRLKKEAEKAKEKGAMDEKALTEYYDNLRQKMARLREQLTQKNKITHKELIWVQNQVQKESGQTLQKIAAQENLTRQDVSEYMRDIAKETQQMGNPESEEHPTDQVISGIEKIEEVIQDAEIHSNFIEENKKAVRIILARDIIPLILKGKTIEITVGDFFHLPLGANEDDYLNFVQHFHYLDKLIAEGKFSKDDYKEIKGITDKVKRIRYKKYFDIFKRGKFKIAALQAVHETWSTGKLFSLKIQED